MEVERRGQVLLTDNSTVTCEGVNVVATKAGLVPRKWYTGLYVFVPVGQMCLFLPSNSSKLSIRVYKPSDDLQPVVLKCKEECRVKENSVVGKLYFLTSAPFPKLVWEE